MLADYVLQSNWLVSRKGKSWDGLALHGAVVGFISGMAVITYLDDVWLPILVLMVVHTVQDFVKVYSGPRLNIHSFIPYTIDQLLHYGMIVGLQVWIGDVSPEPHPAETAFMWTGAAIIVVTRFYDISWWSNWLDMIPYMSRWRLVSYAERLSMLALSAVSLWMFAPLCVLPRLVAAYWRGMPIWRQRRGVAEMAVGGVASVVLGIGLNMVYALI